VNFAKLTSAGAIEWSKNQTSIFGNIPNPVYIDFAQPFAAAVPGGNYAVAFTGIGGLYLAGLGPNGATQWTKVHAFAPNISFFTRAADGGYLLAGSMNNQLWLMKTDSIGAICDTPPPGDYCDSQSNAPWHDWIARVKLNTLDNQSGKSVYSEFTGLNTTLQKGQSYPVTLTTGFSWETFNEYWRVWIDWNHDGVFSTPDEVVQQQVLTAPANGTATASVTGSINVPQGALTGATRMRVAMKRGSYASACENFTNGEVEDYGIIVSNSLNGGTENRNESMAFDATAELSSVRLFGAYHEPEAVVEVVVEKSTDGISFLPLVNLHDEAVSGVVKARDNEPAVGLNHYRMLLRLSSGEVKTSPIQVVPFEPVLSFTVFPNPASAVVHLNLEDFVGKAAHIKLLNAQGIPMKSLTLEEVDAPVLDIRLDGVPSGTYFLWVEIPGRRAVSRTIVVEKGY
jgi:hypothetical protein